MKRKRNIHFGFLPAHPTRADLVKSRRAFKAGVRRKAKDLGAEYRRLHKSARAAVKGKKKLETLFHEVYGQNPRVFPAGTPAEHIASLRKFVRATDMAKKRKSKKKNSRKGKMPAGLKAYWAKKRAAKAKRRNPKRRKAARPRRRKVSLRVRKFRRTRSASKPRRRRVRRSNPRVKRTIRITAPYGLGPKGLRKFRALAAKAYGMRARIIKH